LGPDRSPVVAAPWNSMPRTLTAFVNGTLISSCSSTCFFEWRVCVSCVLCVCLCVCVCFCEHDDFECCACRCSATIYKLRKRRLARDKMITSS
jgi:hypothetical protein